MMGGMGAGSQPGAGPGLAKQLTGRIDAGGVNPGEAINKVGSALRKVWRRFAYELAHANTPTETALGVVMFGCMYVLGWTTGFASATEASANPDTFSAISIMFGLVNALLGTWVLVFMLVVALLVVDKVLIATLFKTFGATDMHESLHTSVTKDISSLPVSIRISFSWCFNVRMLWCIVASFAASLLFAAVHLTYMNIRGAMTADERRFVVRNVFVFNIAIVLAMVVGQFWLDAYWSKDA
jgi:hypothetical protein